MNKYFKQVSRVTSKIKREKLELQNLVLIKGDLVILFGKQLQNKKLFLF